MTTIEDVLNDASKMALLDEDELNAFIVYLSFSNDNIMRKNVILDIVEYFTNVPTKEMRPILRHIMIFLSTPAELKLRVVILSSKIWENFAKAHKENLMKM